MLISTVGSPQQTTLFRSVSRICQINLIRIFQTISDEAQKTKIKEINWQSQGLSRFYLLVSIPRVVLKSCHNSTQYLAVSKQTYSQRLCKVGQLYNVILMCCYFVYTIVCIFIKGNMAKLTKHVSWENAKPQSFVDIVVWMALVIHNVSKKFQ